MAQRKEDEIMAEYLLKGGKMLEKTCRQCGCPQFEYKGKTFCVVCAERDQEKKKGPLPPAGHKARPAHMTPDKVLMAGGDGVTVSDGALDTVITATVLDLCRRIKTEEDPDRCLVLMDAVKIGTEALQILRHL